MYGPLGSNRSVGNIKRETIQGTTYAKSTASRDDLSDSLCLLCSDTANLHQHALVGCNDTLYCAELKQQAIRQSWTDAR